MVGMPGVLNAMLVTPNRIMPPSVCTATNGWVVPKPRAVRSARVRLSLQAVGVCEVVQAPEIHWATKILAALLGDGAIVIMEGAAKTATERVRARPDMRLMEISPILPLIGRQDQSDDTRCQRVHPPLSGAIQQSQPRPKR